MTTTDPQHEMFDLYDASGQPLGTSKPRGEVHRDGDWHRSLHLWVWGVDGGEPFVVFQRRSMTKDTWPGALDIAVGGHFRSGESLAETLREAEEEIGLVVTEANIVKLGRRFHDWRDETFHDCEINEVYAVRCDQPLTAYHQHPQEIDELIRINVDDALWLFRGRAATTSGMSCQRSGGSTGDVRLGTNDFVDMSDDYAVRALLAIQQLATGQLPEPFIIRPVD